MTKYTPIDEFDKGIQLQRIIVLSRSMQTRESLNDLVSIALSTYIRDATIREFGPETPDKSVESIVNRTDGRNTKLRRESLNLHSEGMASFLNMEHEEYYSREAGKLGFSPESLKAVCGVLEMKTEDLFFNIAETMGMDCLELDSIPNLDEIDWLFGAFLRLKGTADRQLSIKMISGLLQESMQQRRN